MADETVVAWDPSPAQETPQVEPAADIPEDGRPDYQTMEAELRRARSEAAKYREQRNEWRTKYQDAEKVFPNLGEMTPEQLVSTLQTERDERVKVESRLRDYQMSDTLRAVTAEHEVDHDLTVALLRAEGRLSDVDISDPAASQVLSDLVADVKASKPQLTVKPGASPVSGSGVTPGGNDTVSAQSRAAAALRAGDYDGYLEHRRAAEGANAGNGTVSLVTL